MRIKGASGLVAGSGAQGMGLLQVMRGAMADFRKLVARYAKAERASETEAVSWGNRDGRRWLTSFVVLIVCAVVLWFGVGTAGRLARVEQQMAELSQRLNHMADARAGDESLRAEVAELGARVNDLAVIIEGPFSHLRQSNEESLVALTDRLEKLEKKVAGIAGAESPVVATSGDRRPQAKAEQGGWVINLISLSNEKVAREQLSRLRKAGVRVELQHAQQDGKSWYRLRVPGFNSYEGARAYIETVEKQAGVQNAWVAKE